jgi:putative Holliday junction resolvase
VSRVLALDYGSARCGAAVSDPTGVLATPLDSILDPASERGLGEIARLVGERGVEEVVVGLPVSLSGAEGAQAAEAREFAARLEEHLDVPVTTYDERYTTALARRTPGRRPEDSRAAAHLLESYLSARR